MLNKVVVLNLAFVLIHQVDGAYWREWEMFRLPGGIQLNNFINVLTFVRPRRASAIKFTYASAQRLISQSALN